MGSFEVLPHTADVGFRATGASLADLFETATRAMFSIEYDVPSVAPEEERAVEAQADDIESLLEAWLSELLWLHDATGFVPGPVSVHDIGPVAAEGAPARIVGTADDPAARVVETAGDAAVRVAGTAGSPAVRVAGVAEGRLLGDWFEQTGPQIKAVTFHGLEVRQVDGHWEATVYLDV